MRKLLTIYLLLFFALHGNTQNRHSIDSLHYLLDAAKDDKTRIMIKTELCAAYRLGHTDSSNLYGQEALEKARQIGFPEGEILALGFMSVNLEAMGNFSKSLEFGFKALQVAKENNLEHLTAPALNAMAEVYTILKDYPKALFYLRKQRSISPKDGRAEGLAYALKDLGVVFLELNQLDSATYYELEAAKVFPSTGREEPIVFETLGDIKMKSGNISEALRYYHKSLGMAIQNNERRASATSYNKIALYYKLMNVPDSGIYFASKGLDVSDSISQKKTILEAAELLAYFYEQKNPQQALKYLKIANIYKDSLFGSSNLQAIKVLADREEAYQKEIEQSEINFRNRLKQYGFIAGMFILLLVALILYRNNRQKQKANKILEATLTNLRSTQTQLVHSEKMASLGELTAGIAHEIQNPLNFVNNFSEVNDELLKELKTEAEKGNLEEVKAIANDIAFNSEKINHHGKRADSIVKGMLQHSRTSSGQKEPTDINALCDEYLRLAYHGLRAKDKSFNATTKTEFDNNISKIKVNPQDMGRVILNLINNAFYAVSEKAKQNIAGYEPTVTVSTRKIENKIEINVKDNGNGIPQRIFDKVFQPFFTTKPTGQGTGLGLSLSYDIVKAHGGEIRVQTREGEGTTFIIDLGSV